MRKTEDVQNVKAVLTTSLRTIGTSVFLFLHSADRFISELKDAISFK